MTMDPALDLHRLQFAFTATFHYLFPQLTMGLALLVFAMKTMALRTGQARWNEAARFWIRVFGINFAFGVVTGIPLEFQFATNWARFTEGAGAVVGHTLGMEGMYAFFLESSFLALLVWGERRLSPRAHWGAALALFVGTWLSGWFIVATNAFMQHPVGHKVLSDGSVVLESFSAFLTNPWAVVQYAHTMIGSLVTASFVVAAVGAWWSLRGEHESVARTNLAVGTSFGLASAILVAFPTGDWQGKLVAEHQPASLAAMEGRFESGTHAELVLIGQPDIRTETIDNPIVVPGMLSFIAYGSFSKDVKGLADFPHGERPDQVELLYYAFHIMVGLGTLFIVLMLVANIWRWRGKLQGSKPLLWALLLAAPFPYIANTAGWMTTELGRQPWAIHGILRTADASSEQVHGGSTMFTLLGFMGLYLVVGILFLFLIGREIAHGPKPAAGA